MHQHGPFPAFAVNLHFPGPGEVLSAVGMVIKEVVRLQASHATCPPAHAPAPLHGHGGHGDPGHGHDDHGHGKRRRSRRVKLPVTVIRRAPGKKAPRAKKRAAKH